MLCAAVHRAVVASVTLGGLNSRNVLSHGSRGRKSEIKVSAGLVPSEGYRGDSTPGLFLGLWWCAGNL